MNRYLLPVTLTLVSCGMPDAEINSNPAAPDVTGTQTAELHKSRPTLGGYATTGFCNDLREVLPSPVTDATTGGIGVPGALSCYLSYGVDGVSIWGDARIGYGATETTHTSSQVNGQTIGVWNLTLRGASAERLFNAMSTTWSVYLPNTVRVSPSGRIKCIRPTAATSSCEVRGLVGIHTP